jgi:anti-sigma B factor antagonist
VDIPFEISDAVVDQLPIISVAGEIDAATSPALRERLLDQASKDNPTIVIDLTAVSFLDSTALGALVSVRQRCLELGGEVRLVINDPPIIKVFEITGLTEAFPISSTLDQAVGR